MVWVRNRETVTDWGEILLGCELPRGIQPSDIDGIIEINDRFLVLEKKRIGEPMLKGQRMLLDRLAHRRGFTVLTLTVGQDGVEMLTNHRTGQTERTNPAEFIAKVEKWAQLADAGSI